MKILPGEVYAYLPRLRMEEGEGALRNPLSYLYRVSSFDETSVKFNELLEENSQKETGHPLELYTFNYTRSIFERDFTLFKFPVRDPKVSNAVRIIMVLAKDHPFEVYSLLEELEI